MVGGARAIACTECSQWCIVMLYLSHFAVESAKHA